MTGIITRLTDKSFGFITAEGLSKDLFFHSNSLVGIAFDELRPGDGVNFETEESPKGLNAVNVQRDGWSGESPVELVVGNADSRPTDILRRSVAIESMQGLTEEVIRRLRRNPIDLYQLHPKMFEELVAKIFQSEGYSTELIKGWNQADGGIDILALRRDVGGFQVRYAIQCKRFAANRLITADPIRALAGVLDRFNAHVGVVATTSYFTKPTRAEVEAHFWKIDLRDYESIVASLKRLELLQA